MFVVLLLEALTILSVKNLHRFLLLLLLRGVWLILQDLAVIAALLLASSGLAGVEDDVESSFTVDLADGALLLLEGDFKDLSIDRPDKLWLECSDQELRLARQLVDEGGDGGAILGVKGVIKLVKDVEWGCVKL